MKFRTLLAIVLLMFPLTRENNLSGQSLLGQPQEKAAQKDTTPKVPKSIPLGDINSASTRTYTLFGNVSQLVSSQTTRNNLSNRVDTVIQQTTAFFDDTSGMDFTSLNFRELEILNNAIRLLRSEISSLKKIIDSELKELQTAEDEILWNRQRWALTMRADENADMPSALNRRIRTIISQSDSVARVLQDNLDFLLTLSDKVTGQEIKLDQFEAALEDYSRINSRIVFRRDMPPIWAVFSQTDTREASEQWDLFQTNLRDDSTLLFRESFNKLILVLLLFIGLIIVVFWLKATIADYEIKWKKVMLSLYINEIFRKPIEVALLIGLYIIWLIIPEMPTTYGSILAIISVYAIFRLAVDILPKGYRGFLIGFSIAYLVLRFHNLFYDQHILTRLLLLSSQVIALIYLIRFIQVRSRLYTAKRKVFSVVISILSVVYLIFLSIALIANIVGTVSFSEFLSGGVIRSGFLVITTYVGFHLSGALAYLLMNSNLFKDSRIIKKQGGYIYSKVQMLLRIFFVISWIFISLGHFNVRDVISEWGTEILTNSISIGKASFSLMSIILFFFVIWLSIWISRFLRHILMEEVFPRVKVERGMPGTIIMLLRITVISIGFLLAAAAAGMKLSNLTIIIGAFSVGIGFGLQNIFNNLVSGLILAFERPIKEGDIVELNTLLGTVKKIGIRSSIVRTFSGAEVIVPNGELISKELINWTLSDQFRRVDVRIGVKYGTNPDKVIEILHEVAREHPKVNENPAPLAHFIDFGESSLDFRLLSWVDQEFRFEVESDMRRAINRKLKDADIEIPFPQRDLHIRSADPKAGKNLKG